MNPPRPSSALPYFEVHEGSGPHLLLVHGILSSRAQWLPNLAALSEVTRPVVLELYGHGRSPAPSERSAYHPDRYVEAFEEIRRSLGARRWLLLGQSLGAALTLRYALRHPESVAAHVMTNSNSAFAEESFGERVRPAMEALLRAVEAEGATALERLRVHPRHSRRLPEEVKAALVSEAALHDPRGVALTGVETVSNSPLGERIAANRVPSLLVVGARERAFQPHAERVLAQMPRVEGHRLEAGHAVNLEAAAAFNRVATAFLSRHRDA